jgi:hypothetical protein
LANAAGRLIWKPPSRPGVRARRAAPSRVTRSGRMTRAPTSSRNCGWTISAKQVRPAGLRPTCNARQCNPRPLCSVCGRAGDQLESVATGMRVFAA